MEGLLDGIVVLDLGRVLACPYAATMMADMGATVIKIENPKGGDDTRKMGPFVNGNSVYYANFNRGKVGVTLNLKEPEGKEIFKEMVKKADVVLENYRPGTMEKLGLGYDVLKEVNPGIIYGSISGFGHTGPLSKRAGYDIVGQAMGGLMSTTGWPDGPATRTGTPMGDVLGALNMTVGVLAALVNKQRTGKGEKVDVALVDSVAAAMENITMIYALLRSQASGCGHPASQARPEYCRSPMSEQQPKDSLLSESERCPLQWLRFQGYCSEPFSENPADEFQVQHPELRQDR